MTSDESLAAVVAAFRADPHYLVQMLVEIQHRDGWVSPATITQLASRLNLPRARVEGVAGFYAFLDLKPRGAYRVLFSDHVTDRMLGKADLKDRLCRRLLVEPGHPSEDGLVTVDDTSCIGMPDQGPAALVNGLPVTRLDGHRIDEMAELIRQRRPVADWPQEMFYVDDNVRRAGPLLNPDYVPGSALAAAIARGADATLAEVQTARLRGRGGAGFPTGAKWASARRAPGEAHFVVCNADEGEPGTFKDRVLLNRCPDLVFDGMTVAALVLGAKRGLVYLRGEYRYLLPRLSAVLERRRAGGLLGSNVAGAPGFDFEIEIHLGAGAYVCGEESALIESLEGKRGVPRIRPPFPDTRGYLNQPTAVDNVETFAEAALIALRGGAWCAAQGTMESTGSKLISVSGDCDSPGVYEFPFGVTVAEVLDACGARDTRAVQVSGPSGVTLAAEEFGRRIAFEDVPTAGAFMVFDQSRDLFDVARNFAHFFAHESCGFCTPCRVGTSLARDLMDKIARGHGTASDLRELEGLAGTMKSGSHCGLGHTAGNPIRDTLRKFRGDYARRLRTEAFEPAFDLDTALAAARDITGRDDAWAHIGSES